MKYDIHKAGGIIIKDRKLLVVRAKNKGYFIAPGGKLDKGEDSKDALIRELDEELGISVEKENLEEFGSFSAIAAGKDDTFVTMDIFVVKSFNRQIKPQSEIEEIMWINSNIPKDMKLGSIFEHEVVPRLKKSDIID